MKISLYLCFALFLLFASAAHANIIINEIMYNPNGTDTNHEWVEIYNNGTLDINITNWKFRSDTTDHTLYVPPANGGQGSMIISANGYAIIAQNATAFLIDYSGFNSTVIDSSWTDFLNSQNETLILKNSTNSIIDNITYQPTANEGRTLCIIDTSLFHECTPTPGLPNIIYNSTNTANATNETNQTNNTASNTTNSCDLSLLITTRKPIFENEAVSYNLIVNDTLCNNTKHEINITYWAEDLFGNVVKDYPNIVQNIPCYKNINRSWTPDDIFGSEGYYLKANITNPVCNDTNFSNNFYSTATIFKGAEYPQGSYIKIYGVNSGNTAKFGETADVKIGIYKNTTSKYAIYAYIQNSAGTKISETTTIHIKSQNTAYNMTIPIQLKHNCNHAYADGTYIVVIEGLDMTTTDTISISGVSSSVCRVEQTSCSCPTSSSSSCPSTATTTAQKTAEYEIILYNDTLYQGVEFETKIKLTTNTSKNITVYSYVHVGNKIASLGFDGNKWLATWTANQQIIELKNTSIITLRNKIRDDTNPGSYNLRVRVNDGKEHDLDKTIVVKKREEIQILQNTTNGTSENATTETAQNQVINENSINNGITGFFASIDNSNYILKPDPNRAIAYLFFIRHLFYLH